MSEILKTMRATIRLSGVLICSLLLNVLLLMCLATPNIRAQITSSFFSLILHLCGVELNCKIPRSERLTKDRIVIVANHVSYLDVLILCSLRPCIFLAKREISTWPIFGWIARALGCIFVERESLMGRAQALKKCLTAAQSSTVALFPEGTTTSARLPELTSWARGHAWIAQRSNADSILCLGLIYENQDDCAWTDDMSLIPHLLKTLKRRTTPVTVTGAWVPVTVSDRPTELAKVTHEQLCLAVSYECS